MNWDVGPSCPENSWASGFAGGHLNPAVSLGLVVAGRISFVRGLVYTICQVLGATIGAALIRAVRPLLLLHTLSHAYHAGLNDDAHVSCYSTLQHQGDQAVVCSYGCRVHVLEQCSGTVPAYLS